MTSQLTCATQSFPSHSCEHVEAKVAIGRFVEMLQPPKVSAVIANILKDLEKILNLMF